MGYRSNHHRFCEPATVRVDTPRGADVRWGLEHYVGTYSHRLFGNLTIASQKGTLYLEIGRFGNASVHCWTSPLVCELKFHGILWWISDSDAFHADPGTNRTVTFANCRGHMRNVSLPLFSTLTPPVFTWIEPSDGSLRFPECESYDNQKDLDRSGSLDDNEQDNECNRLTQPLNAAGGVRWTKIDQLRDGLMMVCALVVACLSTLLPCGYF